MNKEKTWIKDANGNRCSVQRFGSAEAAKKALDSLDNCSDCSDCSDCFYCSYCSGWKGNKPPTQESPSIPKIANIHQAVFDAASRPSALDMGAWHTCDTTHCRAGWVVHLAGEAGRALEKFHDTPLAAQLIYRESSPLKVSPPCFYETNEMAMADMKRLAEEEAALQSTNV